MGYSKLRNFWKQPSLGTAVAVKSTVCIVVSLSETSKIQKQRCCPVGKSDLLRISCSNIMSQVGRYIFFDYNHHIYIYIYINCIVSMSFVSVDCPRAIERLLKVGMPATTMHPAVDPRAENVIGKQLSVQPKTSPSLIYIYLLIFLTCRCCCYGYYSGSNHSSVHYSHGRVETQ